MVALPSDRAEMGAYDAWLASFDSSPRAVFITYTPSGELDESVPAYLTRGASQKEDGDYASDVLRVQVRISDVPAVTENEDIVTDSDEVAWTVRKIVGKPGNVVWTLECTREERRLY